jgi:dihydroorotate dehydrogenase (NAD+) catalytic subunit
VELNISCPNVKMGGMAFGTNPVSAREVIKKVRKAYSRKLIVKLSPNVTNITEFAIIAEEEGADAVSLVNTLLGWLLT